MRVEKSYVEFVIKFALSEHRLITRKKAFLPNLKYITGQAGFSFLAQRILHLQCLIGLTGLIYTNCWIFTCTTLPLRPISECI